MSIILIVFAKVLSGSRRGVSMTSIIELVKIRNMTILSNALFGYIPVGKTFLKHLNLWFVTFDK